MKIAEQDPLVVRLLEGDSTAIVQVRRALGLTQVAFGAQLEVAPETVCRWECGDFKPSRLAYLAIAALLVLKVDGFAKE